MGGKRKKWNLFTSQLIRRVAKKVQNGSVSGWVLTTPKGNFLKKLCYSLASQMEVSKSMWFAVHIFLHYRLKTWKPLIKSNRESYQRQNKNTSFCTLQSVIQVPPNWGFGSAWATDINETWFERTFKLKSTGRSVRMACLTLEQLT